MSEASAPQSAAGSEPSDPAALLSALELVGANEARLTQRFYEIFFERRPDVLPLFGAYSLAEREEMIHETLRSILDFLELEPWLDGNLIALGRSHAEYGVENDMYPPFVDAFVECATEVSGGAFDARAERALRSALERITWIMSEAGEAHCAG
jgi:hemoglobin-like flavoprotein